MKEIITQLIEQFLDQRDKEDLAGVKKLLSPLQTGGPEDFECLIQND